MSSMAILISVLLLFFSCVNREVRLDNNLSIEVIELKNVIDTNACHVLLFVGEYFNDTIAIFDRDSLVLLKNGVVTDRGEGGTVMFSTNSSLIKVVLFNKTGFVDTVLNLDLYDKYVNLLVKNKDFSIDCSNIAPREQ